MAKNKGKKSKSVSKGGERLRALVDLMESENLNELEVSEGNFHVRLVRTPAAPVAAAAPVVHHSAPAPKKAGAAKQEETGPAIKSPIAGVYYSSPSPSSPPFVSVGDHVTTGQVLCIIEAMKVMNEITADKAGRIKKILVENGNPISPGQILFTLETA